MFSPVAPAHRVSARERFAARPGVDVLSPRGSDAALRLSSLHERLASTRSGRWTGEGAGCARPTAVSWNSHRFLRKQHEVRTNAYSGGGSASARSIAGLDRSPGRINFARLPWHDNELSVRLGASRDMRGTTTPHHNDGTVGKDTRMRQQLAFPGGYERGNLRGGLPVHPRADVRAPQLALFCWTHKRVGVLLPGAVRPSQGGLRGLPAAGQLQRLACRELLDARDAQHGGLEQRPTRRQREPGAANTAGAAGVSGGEEAGPLAGGAKEVGAAPTRGLVLLPINYKSFSNRRSQVKLSLRSHWI